MNCWPFFYVLFSALCPVSSLLPPPRCWIRITFSLQGKHPFSSRLTCNTQKKITPDNTLDIHLLCIFNTAPNLFYAMIFLHLCTWLEICRINSKDEGRETSEKAPSQSSQHRKFHLCCWKNGVLCLVAISVVPLPLYTVQMHGHGVYETRRGLLFIKPAMVFLWLPLGWRKA